MPARTSPAPNGKIETIGIDPPVKIEFVVKGEGISDSIATSYSLPGGNPIVKLAFQKLAGATKIAGLARKNEGVQPKTLSFNIEWRASKTRTGKYSTGLIIEDIQRNIAQLQSLCCPIIGSNSVGEAFIGIALTAAGRSFPLCRLVIAQLYDLRVLVTQVSTTWSNLWSMSEGKPMGADINLGVEIFDYYTHGSVRDGQAFYTSGWPKRVEDKSLSGAW